MAIKTVNSDNLMEFVAARNPDISALSTSAQIVDAIAPRTEPDKAVVASGEETVSTAPDPGEQEPSAKKGPKPVQPRIDELTKEKKDALEFAEEEYGKRLDAERRVKELEEQVKALAPKPEVKEPELVAPDPSKYTDQGQFNKDWEKYQDQVIDRKVAARLEAERAADRERQMFALLAERVGLARKSLPDFDEVIRKRESSKLEVPGHIVAAIHESPYGPQLAYYMAKHPKEEERIYSMSPAKALLALGKIEMEYEPKAKAEEPKPEATKTPPQTRAPAPITTLKGEGGAVPEDLSGPLAFPEYKRRRDAEKRSHRH